MSHELAFKITWSKPNRNLWDQNRHKVHEINPGNLQDLGRLFKTALDILPQEDIPQNPIWDHAKVHCVCEAVIKPKEELYIYTRN